MKQLLRQFRSYLHRFGIDIHRYPTTRMTVIRRRALLAQLEIQTFLDVGANTGEFAQEVRQDGFAGTILSFEPLSAAYAQLEERSRRDTLWKPHHCAVGSEAGNTSINISQNSVSSSLLPMQESHERAAPASKIINTEQTEVTTLESVYNQTHFSHPAYLKIDTQGFELEVLKGGEAILPHIPAIELEASLTELYAGQPLLHDVHQWLADRGYYLTSIEEGFVDRARDHVLQVECIYLQNPEHATLRSESKGH